LGLLRERTRAFNERPAFGAGVAPTSRAGCGCLSRSGKRELGTLARQEHGHALARGNAAGPRGDAAGDGQRRAVTTEDRHAHQAQHTKGPRAMARRAPESMISFKILSISRTVGGSERLADVPSSLVPCTALRRLCVHARLGRVGLTSPTSVNAAYSLRLSATFGRA
jgi:hypothetical protein